MGDNSSMFKIKETEALTAWLGALKDKRAKAAILNRLDRATQGNLGWTETVGKGVSEMKIDVGQGYRVYYTIRNLEIVVLLCGGTKSTQKRDIEKAQEIAAKI